MVHSMRVSAWPSSPVELEAAQRALASAIPPPWRSTVGARVGGCFVCFERGESGPGRAGDRAWAAATVDGEVSVVEGAAGAPYEAGLLALREGPLLEAAVRALADSPEVLLVNATGRDHPRRAGLALHLGSVLDLPSVGVTHRTLLAAGEWPPDEPGARAPLLLGGEFVGYWVRTKRGRRPLAVHAAWRTDPKTAADVVLTASGRARTPEPLRHARRAARTARAGVSFALVAESSNRGDVMADRVRGVDYFYVTIPDAPGEGDRLLSALRNGDVNLLAYLGFPVGGGQSQIDFVPEDAEALRQAVEGAGLALSEAKRVFLVEGDDRVGAVADTTAKLAAANINVTAAAAASAGSGRYGMILWVAPGDYERAADVLSA